MKVPIYYIKSDHVNEHHMIFANAGQKKFSMQDYLNLFAVKHKNAHYLRLTHEMKACSLGLKAYLNLILSCVNTDLINFVKEGTFVYPQSTQPTEMVEFYKNFIAFIDDRLIRPRSMFTTAQITRSLNWLYRTTNFKQEWFFSRLQDQWPKLRPQGTTENWYRLFITIYNNRCRDPIKNEFLKDQDD
jgi:hypothetical protein